MTEKQGRSGPQTKLLALLHDDPTALWTRAEVMTELDLDQKQAENLLHRLRIEKLIHRHKDSNAEGERQYAIKIAAANIDVHTKQQYNTGSKAPRKSKAQALSAKEVRMLFMQIQRQLATMEDAVVAAVEAGEDTRNTLAKVENLL